MHIVLLKNLFSTISSIIIFVICRSAKEYVHGEVHEEMLTQTISVLEPEQCLEIGNYKYSFDRNFIILWQMELMCFVVFLFCFWYILFILSFGGATIVNREMKSVSAICFMTKLMAM